MAIKQKLGTLNQIRDLRTIWANEASDFTPWLAENINLLGDVLDLDLSVVEIESPVGDFSLDILAQENNTEAYVIIENQLEDSNHTHLGQLITYASGKEARFVIWVLKHAREEHRSAIEWLNKITDDSVGFFLVEVQLWSINGSDPAPVFNVVEQPNNWTKVAKQQTGTVSKGESIKYAYWNAFNAFAEKDDVYNTLSKIHKASSHHWYTISVGISGVSLCLLLNTVKNTIGVELYISNNKHYYDVLYDNRLKIEEEIGSNLLWYRLDDKKASSIDIVKSADVSNPSSEQFRWLIDMAAKFKSAMIKYLQ